ncbi:hypothetical protein AUJ87_03540 [Candidatus Gracilibacteria bacterium CG1_02_38_174]|nr:MAG: hypothetical protein AUJ87_03540 [Candidatus Gracilibacteria bacterium CG1_02_38_174]PIQ11380.1 MAG: hypothetical protein COW68_02815 [Candidatus Gracilibacteria bacterium CG18_big_fil_WC_8_21_14_2_50_38_16]PIQ41943.1 MAG: hypothetical protein COW06_01240 [Candidatus Gracilibacteria bacterium CG12_big_fil_rev_8_21_14_0_65_38_15]PIZ01284.1 MAG: hypothetical protein COY60_04325 [Candidatus Gracilibacteria bacterium CG_4_10_14_0_8_um_filter_38_28]
MILKNYQEKHVQELFNTTLRLISDEGAKSIVFKAPTGSGKTIMMQEYLRRLAETPQDREFAFVWISVNDLSRQSKRSFERNLAGSPLHFSELSDITDRELKKNEILFINWESIRSIDRATGEWKVLAMKDNERDENLPTYLANTHEAGREVILIVDESHRSLATSKAQELIMNYIKPKLQIEVSATPDSVGYDAKVETKIEEVIEAGMIKKEVLINPGLGDTKDVSETDKFIIDEALKKARELRAKYEEIGSSVRPLVLIQLPSESKTTSELDKTKLERTKQVLDTDFSISLANKKLAIWLSDEKENLDSIESYESPVEVLIFKQAIATGWDCPRAQILVMFREIGSITFEIQTVGRILRMPEQKHYNEYILDVAYAYTDLERAKIGIHEMAKNLIKDKFSKRKEVYENISLPSTFLRRTEYNDLGFSFYRILTESFLSHISSSSMAMLPANMKKLQEMGVKTDNVMIRNNLITDGKILVDIDHHTGEAIYSNTTIETKTEEELVKLAFDVFCREQVRPQFTNIARSYKAIIEALYITLEEHFFGRETSRYYFQCLILSNKEFFMDVLTKAKEIYLPVRRAEVEDKRKTQIISRNWNIPSITAFPEDSVEVKYTKNILEPFYTGKLSKGEKLFIEEYLEKNPNILWWYRNGVKSELFFSLIYKDSNGDSQNFFPDFIVQYADGTIGIFDPKDGFTLEKDRPKYIPFAQYTEELKAQGRKVICGFIRVEGETNPTFYRSIQDDYGVDNMSGWERM